MRVGRPHLILLAAPLAALAAGCGTKTINTNKAEAEIAKGIEQQTRISDVTVKCPDDVEAKQGDTFRCTASARGQTASVQVVQRDDDGNIRRRLGSGR
jgi:Domain of unknown function (DUF4333)